MVLADIHVLYRLTVDDDLTARVTVGFKQHGIHPPVGFDPGRLGLDDLGPAHLPPIRGDVGIQRHILGFEGRNPVAVLHQDTAEGRRQDRFTGV